MKPQVSPPTLSAEPERYVVEKFGGVRNSLGDCVHSATDYAQKKPQEALLWALAAGYILRLLPVLFFARLLLRVMLGLLKPLAVVYGGLKIYQKVRNTGAPRGE